MGSETGGASDVVEAVEVVEYEEEHEQERLLLVKERSRCGC